MSNEKNLAMRFALEAALKQTKKPRGFKEGHKAGVRARGMTSCVIYADDAPYQKFIVGVDPGIGEDGKPMVDGIVIGHKFSTDFGDRGVIVGRKDLLTATPLAETEYFNRRQALVTEEAIAKRVVGTPSVEDSEGGLDETYALRGDLPAYALEHVLKAKLSDGKIKFEPKIHQAVLIDPFQSAVDVDLQINDLDSVTMESRSATRAAMFLKPRKVTPGVFTMQDKHSFYQRKNDEFRVELETLEHPLNHDRVKLKIVDAQELLLESKGGLVGQKIYTMSTEDFAGGLVAITEIAPDDNCQEIIFQVTNEAGQTMGVFFDEVIGVPV